MNIKFTYNQAMAGTISGGHFLVLSFIAALTLDARAQPGAALPEITVQQYQRNGGSARLEAIVVQEWIFRSRPTAGHCEVLVQRNNIMVSSHTFNGVVCSSILDLAAEVRNGQFANAVNSEPISDRQNFRIRLSRRDSWHEVSKVAPKIGTIDRDGVVLYTPVAISPAQQLLWNIQVMGSGARP